MFIFSRKEVAYLECDVGQTEFTPPACLALNIIRQPLLGLCYCHLNFMWYSSFRSHWAIAFAIATSLYYWFRSIKEIITSLSQSQMQSPSVNKVLVLLSFKCCTTLEGTITTKFYLFQIHTIVTGGITTEFSICSNETDSYFVSLYFRFTIYAPEASWASVFFRCSESGWWPWSVSTLFETCVRGVPQSTGKTCANCQHYGLE